MILTGFPAFQGLGVIAGSGILLGLLETFTLLPAAVVLWTAAGRCDPDSQGPVPFEATFARLGERMVAIPSLGLLAALALGVLFLEPAGTLRFDMNVLSMNAPDSDPMRLQDSMLEDFGFFPVLNVLVGESLEGLAAAAERLEDDPVIGTVDTLTGQLPHAPEARREEILRLREVLEELPVMQVPASRDP